MTSPDKPSAARRVQGDGRPFGAARTVPRAIIKHEELNRIVDPLGLSDHVARELKKRLREALSLHLGPKVLAEIKASHDRALDLLAMISGSARKLDQHIRALDNDILVLIDEQRAALRGPEQVRHFNFLHFAPAIATLGEAAEKALDELKPRGRGGQQKVALDKVIEAMLAALNKCGLEVRTSDSGSRVADRRKMTEPGGELLKSLFAHFDPHVTEAELVGAVERVRRPLNGAS